MKIKVSIVALLAVLSCAATKEVQGRSLLAKRCSRSGTCELDNSDIENLDEGTAIEVKLDSVWQKRKFVRKSVRARNVRGYWYGQEESGEATMNLLDLGKSPTTGKKVLFGSVTDGGVVYEISPNAQGDTVATAIPVSEFPPEDHLDDHSRRLLNSSHVPSEINSNLRGSGASSSSSSSSSSDDSNLNGDHGAMVTLDVMVVWTKHAECRNSKLERGCELNNTTRENMEGRIALAVSETNTAFALSGIHAQLRLVHSYRHRHYVEREKNPFAKAIYALQSPDDGIMDEVHVKRQKYGADLVAMMIDDDNSCGTSMLGPEIDSMFSVTAWRCATGYYSFGHEIGHNLGCFHDRGSADACRNKKKTSYGWRDPEASFRTIMAYNCDPNQCDENAGGNCTRVQYFSSPNIAHENKLLGDVRNDNVKQINAAAPIAASFFSAKENCSGAADCDDGNPCTNDVCGPDKKCTNPPITCTPSNQCFISQCVAGLCIDTPKQLAAAATCSNGLCEAGGGENSDNCPEDCAGKSSGRRRKRFFCGGMSGCKDRRCNQNGYRCTTDQAPIGPSCCGDGICASDENLSSCPADCGVEIFTQHTPTATPQPTPKPAPTCRKKGARCNKHKQCCSKLCWKKTKCK